MSLRFINQDNNRIYFKVYNRINGYISSITELSNTDILKMDIYLIEGLKTEIWNKTI